jgi:hypothetical protein
MDVANMDQQSNIEKFLALSDAKKDAEVEDALYAKPRSLTAAQRSKWKKVHASLKANHAKKLGHPVQGDGVKVKYWEINKTELAQATREFDQEFIADKARPMSVPERAQERRARRRGRPRIGKGAQKIHITLERGLVKRADKVAKQRGMGRSELIAQALAGIIGRKAG